MLAKPHLLVQSAAFFGACREYNIALRTEMKRREIMTSGPQRAAELAAYFTHAKLEPYHTALALGSAMRIFAKLKNYNSCATFCRRLLELNSTQKVMTYLPALCSPSCAAWSLQVCLLLLCQLLMVIRRCSSACKTGMCACVQMSDSARQMLAVCERSPSDAVQLKYDPRNPFDLCSVTFTPIYRYVK